MEETTAGNDQIQLLYHHYSFSWFMYRMWFARVIAVRTGLSHDNAYFLWKPSYLAFPSNFAIRYL